MTAHLTSRRTFLGLTGALFLAPSMGRADTLESLSGRAFGTSWHVTGPAGSGLARFRPEIEAIFARIDREMSPWRPDSTVSRFNAGKAATQPAGTELLRVTEAALALAGASGGAFDPTVGPLVAQWGFGPIKGDEVPDWRGLSTGAGRIAKDHPGLTLDLCGIAKGRALDLAVTLLRDRGQGDLLFDLGGELRALGHHPAGRAWHVAVEPPGEGGPLPAVLRLEDGRAVATSGLKTQSYVLGGRTWGHIIDPLAARPVAGVLRSVTVVADDAMTADGWATALFAAGDTGGPALAEAQGISALFLFGDGPAPRQVRTGAIEALLT